MRGKKAKAIRAIAKKQAIAGNVPLEDNYKVAPLAKVPVPTMKDGKMEITLLIKPSKPTLLHNCSKAIYRQLKKLV